MKNAFNVGDLIRHSTYSRRRLDRGYGIVIALHPTQIKCVWTDGKQSWIHPGQLTLISRGQNGKLS